MIPLASFTLALCNMRLDRLYFLWTIITVANTVLFNILVYKYPPVIGKKLVSEIGIDRSLRLNEDIYSFFWALC